MEGDVFTAGKDRFWEGFLHKVVSGKVEIGTRKNQRLPEEVC